MFRGTFDVLVFIKEQVLKEGKGQTAGTRLAVKGEVVVAFAVVERDRLKLIDETESCFESDKSLDNAIVVDNYRVLNEDGLRFESEFVTHKVLDAIGDLYLLGSSLIGAYEGYKSGHELNNRLLRELMARQDAWEYTYFDEQEYFPAVKGDFYPVEA